MMLVATEANLPGFTRLHVVHVVCQIPCLGVGRNSHVFHFWSYLSPTFCVRVRRLFFALCTDNPRIRASLFPSETYFYFYCNYAFLCYREWFAEMANDPHASFAPVLRTYRADANNGTTQAELNAQ